MRFRRNIAFGLGGAVLSLLAGAIFMSAMSSDSDPCIPEEAEGASPPTTISTPDEFPDPENPLAVPLTTVLTMPANATLLSFEERMVDDGCGRVEPSTVLVFSNGDEILVPVGVFSVQKVQPGTYAVNWVKRDPQEVNAEVKQALNCWENPECTMIGE